MPRPLCLRCTRPLPACYCHLLVAVDNHWPVLILQHAGESRHALNTARIAQLCLQRVAVQKVQDGDSDATLQQILPAHLPAPVLVYPGEGGIPPAQLAAAPAVPLLFLDASWRKSRRMFLQSPWLQGLPRMALAPMAPARYRIRREPRPGYRSTLEAIVEVLGMVDGCPAEVMLPIMDWMVAQQIAGMGAGTYAENYPLN